MTNLLPPSIILMPCWLALLWSDCCFFARSWSSLYVMAVHSLGIPNCSIARSISCESNLILQESSCIEVPLRTTAVSPFHSTTSLVLISFQVKSYRSIDSPLALLAVRRIPTKIVLLCCICTNVGGDLNRMLNIRGRNTKMCYEPNPLGVESLSQNSILA